MSRANWATSGFDDMRAKPTRAVQRLRPRAYESPVWQYRVARTDDLRPKRRHDARSLQRPKHRRRTSPEHRSGPQDRRRDHPSLIRSIARPSAMTCYLATHRRRRSLDRGCDRSHRIASHRIALCNSARDLLALRQTPTVSAAGCAARWRLRMTQRRGSRPETSQVLERYRLATGRSSIGSRDRLSVNWRVPVRPSAPSPFLNGKRGCCIDPLDLPEIFMLLVVSVTNDPTQ